MGAQGGAYEESGQRGSEERGSGYSPSWGPMKMGSSRLGEGTGWRRAGTVFRGHLALLIRGGPGSLTRDVPCHVHSHGDSEAKTQVDTEVAPKFVS